MDREFPTAVAVSHCVEGEVKKMRDTAMNDRRFRNKRNTMEAAAVGERGIRELYKN